MSSSAARTAAQGATTRARFDLVRHGGVKGWIWRAALALDLIALYWLVWTPADSHACNASTSLIGGAFCLNPALTWLGNLMLLVPTTALLVLGIASMRRWRLALAMFAFACLIEIVQRWIPGRYPDWRDVATNAGGAWMVLGANALKRARAMHFDA